MEVFLTRVRGKSFGLASCVVNTTELSNTRAEIRGRGGLPRSVVVMRVTVQWQPAVAAVLVQCTRRMPHLLTPVPHHYQ